MPGKTQPSLPGPQRRSWIAAAAPYGPDSPTCANAPVKVSAAGTSPQSTYDAQQGSGHGSCTFGLFPQKRDSPRMHCMPNLHIPIFEAGHHIPESWEPELCSCIATFSMRSASTLQTLQGFKRHVDRLKTSRAQPRVDTAACTITTHSCRPNLLPKYWQKRLLEYNPPSDGTTTAVLGTKGHTAFLSHGGTHSSCKTHHLPSVSHAAVQGPAQSSVCRVSL